MRGEVTLLRLLEPFTPALSLPDTREVVVNRPGEFGVEGDSGWSWYQDDRLTYDKLEAIGILSAANTGQDIGPSCPTVSSRLPAGERITIAMPPLTNPGTVSLTIRKRAFSFTPTLEWLHDRGYFSFLDPSIDWVETLHRWVAEERLNIEITAETGAGKTTLLEALARCIPENDRIITLESVPELILPHRNWVPILYAQEGQGKNRGATQALEMALRQRPDRIIPGETRTGETWAYLRAMASGHRGCLSTTHASPGVEGMIDALSAQIRQNDASKGVPQETITRMLMQNIHVLICVEKKAGDAIPFRAKSIERIAA